MRDNNNFAALILLALSAVLCVVVVHEVEPKSLKVLVTIMTELIGTHEYFLSQPLNVVEVANNLLLRGARSPPIWRRC